MSLILAFAALISGLGLAALIGSQIRSTPQLRARVASVQLQRWTEELHAAGWTLEGDKISVALLHPRLPPVHVSLFQPPRVSMAMAQSAARRIPKARLQALRLRRLGPTVEADIDDGVVKAAARLVQVLHPFAEGIGRDLDAVDRIVEAPGYVLEIRDHGVSALLKGRFHRSPPQRILPKGSFEDRMPTGNPIIDMLLDVQGTLPVRLVEDGELAGSLVGLIHGNPGGRVGPDGLEVRLTFDNRTNEMIASTIAVMDALSA